MTTSEPSAALPPIGNLSLRLSGETAAVIEDAGRAIERLMGSADALREVVARASLRAEAVASSRFGSVQAGHQSADWSAGAPGPRPAAARPVATIVAAMEEAIQVADGGPLTVDALHRIHQRLVAGTHTEPVGGLPHPERVVLLRDLVRFAQRRDVPAVAQAAIGHARFDAIHGYFDGNNTMARILVHVILRQRGLRHVVLPISAALGADPRAYVAAAGRFQQDGDADGWLCHFATTITVAARQAAHLGERVSSLVAEWSSAVGCRHRDSAVSRMLPLLVQQPVVTAATAARSLGITDTAARRVLADLERAGVVRQLSSGRRNRVWSADAAFAVLDPGAPHTARVSGARDR